MITTEKTRNVEVNSTLRSSEFKIQTSAKAFKILSDSLYSNKIRAVVRELSTNAIDACIEAVKPVQVEVHLPTALEPYFSVTDHGCGMSDEQVLDLYTTYFSSSKTNTNDQIGALGLGSKSPFAYTQNFTIDTCKDGSKRAYSCFMNNTGVAEIVMLNEQVGDFENGTTIKVSVKESDYKDFLKEAAYIYWGFDYEMTVTGAESAYNEHVTENYSKKTVMAGSNWKMLRSKSNTCFVRMGGILYPITSYDLNLDRFGDDRDLDSLLDTRALVLDMAIGTVEIAPSREALSFDEVTIENIKKALRDVMSGIRAEITNKVAEGATMWERASIAYSLRPLATIFNMKMDAATQTVSPLLDVGRPFGYLEEFKSGVCGELRYEYGTYKKVTGYNTVDIQVSENAVLFGVANDKDISSPYVLGKIRSYLKEMDMTGKNVYIMHEAAVAEIDGAPFVNWETVMNTTRKPTTSRVKSTPIALEGHIIHLSDKERRDARTIAMGGCVNPLTFKKGIKKAFWVVKGSGSYCTAFSPKAEVARQDVSDINRVLRDGDITIIKIAYKTYKKYRDVIEADKCLVHAGHFALTRVGRYMQKDLRASSNTLQARRYANAYAMIFANIDVFENAGFEQDSVFGQFVDQCREWKDIYDLNVSANGYSVTYRDVARAGGKEDWAIEMIDSDKADTKDDVIRAYPLIAAYISANRNEYYESSSRTFSCWGSGTNIRAVDVVIDYVKMIDNLKK